MARPMTKSALKLARQALATAQQSLPAYGHKFSPRRYTQHQLFALLVLRTFFKTDYRGLVELVGEWSELRRALQLKEMPHFSTLCYAEQRLLRQEEVDRLLQQTLSEARQRGLIETRPEAAVDATGLETRHASQYFVRRTGQKPFLRYRWLKLSLVCHLSSHLFAGVLAGEGPSQDSPQFTPVMKQAAQQIGWHRVVADAAYDGEHNHRLCREQLGIKHTLIPLNRRNSGRRWPKTRYRRQMKHRFSQTRYHQRWQIESAISRHKRRLGSAVKARTLDAQQREGYLRVLTHNLMILRFCA